ncbi:MAG: Holliday junction branch migration protein RuvA [Anaeroplasmataceae bacterium]|jgi:Holliday junction DNA helicase, RuvA subunit|nr:Holliday junction branch migration protein RuvA [Anaeroplasmataceae bacterium]
MYGYIVGVVTKITPKNIIIENHGIGYLLIVSNPYNFSMNQEYKVFLHQYVREDIIDLYGFQQEEEKDLFLKLLSVSGIGPKSALSILATGTVSEIVKAIETRNDTYLRKFPGIGAKASQQIILDLKGKLNLVEEPNFQNTKLEDVEQALLALGYNKKEIGKVLPKLDQTQDEGILVKQALQALVK